MKVAIMQPYFMPYLGYWQLMNVVDKYVVFDDVNYIKRGWVNRNRILINGKAAYFNIPILGGSQNKKINEVRVNHEDKLIRKKLRTIELAYKKAPYFEIIYPMMERILNSKEDKISDYIINSFYVVSEYLDISTEYLLSSAIRKKNDLDAQGKIIAMCKLLGAAEYYNAIGGKKLYSSEAFSREGICLKFLEIGDIKYKQYNNSFQENLSMIDVLMFNSKEDIKEKLGNYTLITN